MTLEVITANRLRDGVVVWLGADGSWVDRIADAVAFEGPASDAALAQGVEAEGRQFLVAPYKIEVTMVAGTPVPVSVKEHIRALGPSVRLDLGKQAEDEAPAAALAVAGGR